MDRRYDLALRYAISRAFHTGQVAGLLMGCLLVLVLWLGEVSVGLAMAGSALAVGFATLQGWRDIQDLKQQAR